MSLLVGICGGSGSGKSTLATTVRNRLGDSSAAILSFDAYYRDLRQLSLAERAASNFDHPDILDVELFIEHLDLLSSGVAVDVPVYDFSTYTRIVGATQLLTPTPIILVEGILLLAFEEIVDRLDLRIYRECPQHVRFARRLRRDTTERGRSPASIEAQFSDTVAPMHERFVKPSRSHAHLVYEHGVLELDDICDEVVATIEQQCCSVAQPKRPAARAAASAASS